MVRFGVFELDLKNRQLLSDGAPLHLQPQALDILAFLVRRADQLVTRDELRSKIWPNESSGDFNSRLNFHIKNIRQALGDDPESPRYVQTVPKSGYKFIAAVDVLEPPPGTDPLPRSDETLSGAWIRIPRFQLTMVAFLLIIACGFVIVKLRSRGSQLTKVSFNGNAVQALGERGQLLWSYNFGRPLREEVPREAGRIQIVDLGGNGRKEVLVMAPLLIPDQPNSPSDALYSFSSDGKLLWRYDFDETVQFGGTRYGPPWGFGALLTTDDGRNPSIWCAVREYFWTPSTLVKLDGEGHLQARFVNWGHILALNHVRTANGSYIVAGGINNECNCAMLAVLREEQPSGSSPRTSGSAISCENCPEGQPYRYFLFPRSEVNQASGATYNYVKVILPDEGGLRVGVAETPSEQPLGPDWKMYQLSADFVPQSVSVSDHYWVLHRQLEGEGKIKHTVEQCPERIHPRTVRMWDRQGGWKNIQVPPVALP